MHCSDDRRDQSIDMAIGNNKVSDPSLKVQYSLDLLFLNF